MFNNKSTLYTFEITRATYTVSTEFDVDLSLDIES